MSPKRTLATTLRVLAQLKHDHRTVGLIILVPSILMTVLYYVFQDSRAVFNNVAPLLLGIIPFTMMFIITSIAVLRERTSGTLERLLTTPTSRLDILSGYSIAFATIALFQACIVSFVVIALLNVTIVGSVWALLAIAVMSGVLGMSVGLFLSAFARTEFQAVQFMPAFVLPQFLTCGLFVPREEMARFLQYFSDAMPITYVVKAMQQVKTYPNLTNDLKINVGIIIGFMLLVLLLGAASLRNTQD